jgi:hypothetical protein
VLWSNGIERGAIQAGASRTWGIDLPNAAPIATASIGLLSAGRYQVCMTYVRDDGQESGPGPIAELDVSDGGINLTGLPVSSDSAVTTKALYLTTANGERFYLASLLANATTTTTLSLPEQELNIALATENLSPPPSGQIVAYYKGHVLVADGDMLAVSQPFGYELFDRRDYLPMGSRITLVAPMDDGVFVATEKRTVWLSGDDLRKPGLAERAQYGAIPGTLAMTEDGGNDPAGRRAIWMSPVGVVVGRHDGSMACVTHERYRPTTTWSCGAGMWKETEKQYLCSLFR